MGAMDGKSVEELNELFANALALKILGQNTMLLILMKGGGLQQNKAWELIKVYKKFLGDYENDLKKISRKAKKI